MKRWRRSLVISVALALAASLAAPPAFAQGAPDEDDEEESLPPPKAAKKKPAPPPAAPAAAQKKAQKAGEKQKAKEKEKERTIEERALRGVVVLERGGQTVGLGSVLSGDGRILTALSPLGLGNDLDARFADGTKVRVKLGHHDRAWDLALVVPQTGRWADGLTASSRDPVREEAKIRSFSALRGKVSAVPMVLKSHRELMGGDDKQLADTIEIGSRVLPQDMGAPVIDEDGRVVAIVGRGCAPNEAKPCTPVSFGVPIEAIKGFLRTVPPTAVQPSAWLGVQGVAESAALAKGVRITVVVPDSPASEAELKGGDRGGDVILAVAGIPVTTPEELAEVVRGHAVSQKVRLTVFSGGKYRQVSVVLGAAPEPKAAPPAELPPPAPSPKRKPAAPPR